MSASRRACTWLHDPTHAHAYFKAATSMASEGRKGCNDGDGSRGARAEKVQPAKWLDT
jgi:hypothetical protein